MSNKYFVSIALKKKSWFFCSGKDYQSVVGYAYHGAALLTKEVLAAFLYQACLKGELSSVLKDLSGNFAAVIQCNEDTYIIGDKLRSYPLALF